MNISELTFTNFMKAVKKTGEKEINTVLETILDRDLKIIDEIADLCCYRMNINKSFLKVKNNRTKTDCVSVIVYILKKNNIKPSDINTYFSNFTIRITETYQEILNLSDNIPHEFRLKSLIKDIEIESEPIFKKYYIN